MSEEEESCLLSPENMKMLKKFHDEVYKIWKYCWQYIIFGRC
jgi:hypothetical protein